MSYEPILPHVYPLVFFYIAFIIFSVTLTVKMGLKWRERHVEPPLIMTVVFLTVTIALAALTTGLLEAAITGFFKEIYRVSLPFAYVTMLVADVLLYLFAVKISGRGRRGLVPAAIVAAIIGVMLVLPANYWGIPSVDYAGETSIRLYSTLALVAYSYMIYITIAVTCVKASKVTSAPVTRAGLRLLAWAMWCMVGFFGMFIVDTLLIVLFDHPGYSEFVYLAWVFALAFFLLAYSSLVMPKGLAARFGKA